MIGVLVRTQQNVSESQTETDPGPRPGPGPAEERFCSGSGPPGRQTQRWVVRSGSVLPPDRHQSHHALQPRLFQSSQQQVQPGPAGPGWTSDWLEADVLRGWFLMPSLGGAMTGLICVPSALQGGALVHHAVAIGPSQSC